MNAKRTLVIGIPLPQFSFDNYSFVSAPSFSDYPRMIVEMAAVSQTVEEVAAGSEQHSTYSGQPVVNRLTSAVAFGLADLLTMRRREAERFLARGGILVAFAHLDVPHPRIGGSPGWRRYAWLPAPEGFRYQEHLLPGFGQVTTTDEDAAYAFAPYLEAFALRLAYRTHFDEEAPGFRDYARVFARSPGGLAVAVEIAVAGGRVILLPPLARIEQEERAVLAGTLLACLDRMAGPPESGGVSTDA